MIITHFSKSNLDTRDCDLKKSRNINGDPPILIFGGILKNYSGINVLEPYNKLKYLGSYDFLNFYVSGVEVTCQSRS
jgi:hypothetical protein